MNKRVLLIFACLFLFMGAALAQNKVTGTVISSEDGQPVIGASVRVAGTKQGTVTNAAGEFTISVPSGASLEVSYIGMITKKVKASRNMRVELAPDDTELDEVFVVAYGTAKKSSFTGSAGVVDSKKLEKRALTNATAALEGNVSGVQVTSALGQPGSSANIRIRGFGSANASNAPLYVVDGAVFNGSIGDINPADIESMTVLKDAASTSLYGSSAGNGVVVITTKKGKEEGKTGFSLTVNQGWSNRAYSDYKRVNAYQYYPLQWQRLKNAYATAGKSADEAARLASAEIVSNLVYNPFSGIADDEVVGTDGKLNPSATALKWGDDLDWEDAAFRTGYRQEYNLSYNTKTKKSDAYASVGYLKDNGYMIKTDFERYSGRVNYNVYPTKYFKTGFNLGVTRSLSNYSTANSSNSSAYSNLARFVRNIGPIYPVHKHDLAKGFYINSDGKETTNPSEYIYDYDGTRPYDNGRDAVAETMFNDRKLERTSETGRTYFTITPIEGLSLTANYAIENVDYRRKVYENPLVGDGTAGPGRLNNMSTRSLTQTFNQIVEYNKAFGSHNVDVMLGHENFSYRYEYLYGMKTQEIVSDLYEFGNFVNISSLSSYTDSYKKEGYFARVNYDYAGKYYASLSYRHDGSSRFSKDNRWGDFWSFGASWRVSEEPFMKNVEWINNLKLRASYGETGNDAVLDDDGDDSFYPYQTLYSIGLNNGNEGGIYLSTVADANLKWETQISKDIAVEFKLFNKLSGSIEYFIKDSKDLLFDVSQPLSVGYESIIQNIGKISNSGVEINLDYEVLRNADWHASVGANATFIKNKIKKLPSTMSEGYISGSKKWVEGKSIYEFWLRQWAGVDPETGDGLYEIDMDKYNDTETSASTKTAMEKTFVTVDGKQYTNSYTYARYAFSGRSIPTVYGGFNFNVGYKNFDLSATFSYQLGGHMLDYTYASLMTADYGENMSYDLFNAWQKAGDRTSVPRLDANATHETNIVQSYSTRWLTSSDCLNLRSVTLGYEFDKDLIRSLYLTGARISLTAENLFMLKARQGLNPMANFAGGSYNEYMPARTITIGINVSF